MVSCTNPGPYLWGIGTPNRLTSYVTNWETPPCSVMWFSSYQSAPKPKPSRAWRFHYHSLTIQASLQPSVWRLTPMSHRFNYSLTNICLPLLPWTCVTYTWQHAIPFPDVTHQFPRPQLIMMHRHRPPLIHMSNYTLLIPFWMPHRNLKLTFF